MHYIQLQYITCITGYYCHYMILQVLHHITCITLNYNVLQVLHDITAITSYYRHYNVLHKLHTITLYQGPDPCVCFRNQRGKKEALIGDLARLAGRRQSHMYPSEDSKRTLAHATSNNKNPCSTRKPTRIRTLIYSDSTQSLRHSSLRSRFPM